MSASAGGPPIGFDGDEVASTVVGLLGDYFASPRRVVDLHHRSSEYATSAPLREVHVVLEGGQALDLILKDVSPGALLPGAREAKPSFLRNARREVAVYREILARADLGTATFYGAVEDDRRGRHWLLIEDVPGLELYQVGGLEGWKSAARWLRRAHEGLRHHADRPESTRELLRYDRSFYEAWPIRAWEFLPAAARRRIRGIVASYGRVIDRLMALPATIIHGEFYASNVLVQAERAPPRICPVDWEMAAVGPGLIDLAALTSGNWSEADRLALALEYRSGAEAGESRDEVESFSGDLDACRMHLAMQWLGWSPTWRPPREQEQDWLAEAVTLAKRLSL